VALNDSARIVTSSGPFGTTARTARSPAPSHRGSLEFPSGHVTEREQRARQEDDAEHDAARGREQQPDVTDAIVDDRSKYVMRTAPWMPAGTHRQRPYERLVESA
jgi:hypothetical protein